MLTDNGLRARAKELRLRAERFGKTSYAEAAEAAERLRRRLGERGGDLRATVQNVDVFRLPQVLSALREGSPDIVMADFPYGVQTNWVSSHPGGRPMAEFLEQLGEVLRGDTVVAIAMQKDKKGEEPLPPTLSTMKIGKRAVLLFRASDL